MQILHLEDSSTDAELAARLIKRAWPQCAIQQVGTQADYCAALERGGFDVILSDYTLPGFDGLSALALAQAVAPQAPFIFLSGTIGEERAVEALKQGATDYIIKDRPTRLVPAIRQAFALNEESERRRRTEEQLQKNEDRLREQASLLDKARDAIVATDLEQRVTYWNASAERLYGWKAGEVLGRRLQEDIALGFETARFAAARAQLLANGEWRGEFRLRTKSGGTVLVESTWSLVVDGEGRPRSILMIDTDVTERKKLETQLLRAQRMESIGTLAGGIAHDLNNVLTPIVVSLDLMTNLATTDDERQLIEKTRATASHGAALVQQLLAFARGGEAKRTRLDPRIAVTELQPLVRQSLPPNVQLLVHADGPVSAIDANVTQFNQVLLNLCLNARDAMPRGGHIEIVIKHVDVDRALAGANPGARPGAYVRIAVSDTGSGIAPGIVERIFDPFFTTKPAGKGTGLGLSMVAGIMKSHGGFVQVESEEGKGTTFFLFFPAAAEAPPPVRVDPPAPARGQGETILLIDDEPVVRTALQMLLQRAGYRVCPAGDGGEAIAEFERHRSNIAVAISDMMLPDRSGVEVVHELRRRSPELPVIAISGMMASGAFDELLTLEPRVECLAKPIAPAVLIGAVRRALPVAAK
ncbi:MAG TPA: response regulator [Opitutaceae bacterium]|nr:response regulator [Opitutaceae bacterium]